MTFYERLITSRPTGPDNNLIRRQKISRRYFDRVSSPGPFQFTGAWDLMKMLPLPCHTINKTRFVRTTRGKTKSTDMTVGRQKVDSS